MIQRAEQTNSAHLGKKLIWNCLKDKTTSKHLLYTEHMSQSSHVLWAFNIPGIIIPGILPGISSIWLQRSKSKSDLETWLEALGAARQKSSSASSNRTEVPGAESLSLVSPLAGQAGGSVSERDHIFPLFLIQQEHVRATCAGRL